MASRTPATRPVQQSCVHCGECARACPEALQPEDLFFALTADDWAGVRAAKLDACSECNRCVEVCPSHIPLLDWFRWGKSGLLARARAEAARTRYQQRMARLAREREERAARRREQPTTANALPAQSISHAEVLAAIARGRSKRKSHQHDTGET